MSYSEFRKEHGSGEFGQFVKAEHVKEFPLKLKLIRVDKQTLPNSGETLIARFELDNSARSQLKADYIKGLDKVKAKDIGFPLNATNGGRLHKMFGDSIEKWRGVIEFKTVAVTNPKTNEEVESLRIVIPEAKK